MSIEQDRVGVHLVADLHDVSADSLDGESIRCALERALSEEGASVVRYIEHAFPANGGVTGVFVLAESHALFHTWPENALVCVDMFICGAVSPEAVLQRVLAIVPAGRVERRVLERGCLARTAKPASEGA